MKRTQSIILGLALLPFSLAAQPPEENFTLLPPDQDSVVAPADEAPGQGLANQQIPAPVAAPIPAPVPAEPEDNTLKGVTLSPSIGLYPIGYDSINLSGDDAGRAYFMMKPSLAISTSFKTSHGRTISFDTSYSLSWREYYNKESALRDFDNELDGNVAIQWNDRISTSVYTYFEYFFKTGADTSSDNGLFLDTNPKLAIKTSDQLSLHVAYYFYLLDLINTSIDLSETDLESEPPSGFSDYMSTSSYSDEMGLGGFYGPDPFGSFSGAQMGTGVGSSRSVWVSNMYAILGLSYKPIDGTTLGFDYKYSFWGLSNDDGNEWTGHFFIPSLSQKLPWEGGKVSVKDEVRWRLYDFATNTDNTQKRNIRNRLTISLSQAVNDFTTLSAYYRWQFYADSSKDYLATYSHLFFTGVTFGF